MATKNKLKRGNRRSWKSKTQDNKASAPSEKPDTKAPQAVGGPATTPIPQTEPEQTIRKAIYLSALIYVEGDQPAPDNFTTLATSTLQDTLTTALKGEHNGLTISLKKIEVQNNVDDADAKTTRFQF